MELQAHPTKGVTMTMYALIEMDYDDVAAEVMAVSEYPERLKEKAAERYPKGATVLDWTEWNGRIWACEPEGEIRLTIEEVQAL